MHRRADRANAQLLTGVVSGLKPLPSFCLLNEIIVKYNSAIAEHILEILPDEAMGELARAHRDATDAHAVRYSLAPEPEGEDR